MKIIITDSTSTNLTLFLRYLIRDIIKPLIWKDFNKEKLINEYAVENELFKKQSPAVKDINLVDVFKKIVDNITYIKVGNDYHILINPTKTYIGYYETLENLSNFISNGNLEVEGYKLLPEVFERVTNEITQYYKDYLLIYHGVI